MIAKFSGGLPVDPIARSKRGSLPRNESIDPGPSVGELCLVFLKHAATHYVKNGKPTSEVDILKSNPRGMFDAAVKEAMLQYTCSGDHVADQEFVFKLE